MWAAIAACTQMRVCDFIKRMLRQTLLLLKCSNRLFQRVMQFTISITLTLWCCHQLSDLSVSLCCHPPSRTFRSSGIVASVGKRSSLEGICLLLLLVYWKPCVVVQAEIREHYLRLLFTLLCCFVQYLNLDRYLCTYLDVHTYPSKIEGQYEKADARALQGSFDLQLVSQRNPGWDG